MNKYRNIIGRINYALFLVAVAALPFPQVFIRYALVIWLVAWLLELRFIQKPQIIKPVLPVILFAIWYVWRAISGLWSPDHRAWSFMMERYLTFPLLLPVAIWGLNEHYNWRTVAKVLAVASAVSVVFYVIFITILYYNPQYVEAFGFNVWHTEYQNWLDCFTFNSSSLKHRLFWCTTLLIGSIAAVQAWRDKPYIYIPIILINLASIPLSGSRQMIFSLAATIIITIIYLIQHQTISPHLKRLETIILITLILGASVSLFCFHPRMKAMLQGDITIEQLTVHEPRVSIWAIALSSPKDYFWQGLGGGQSVNYLEHKYDEFYMAYYKSLHYHAHNQYLEELMELGIFGMLLFIAAWIALPLTTKGIAKQTAIYFTTIAMLNMLTDCMWGKFDGIAIFAITYTYILIQSIQNTKNSA